jgi:hypothetical protein
MFFMSSFTVSKECSEPFTKCRMFYVSGVSSGQFTWKELNNKTFSIVNGIYINMYTKVFLFLQRVTNQREDWFCGKFKQRFNPFWPKQWN